MVTVMVVVVIHHYHHHHHHHQHPRVHQIHKGEVPILPQNYFFVLVEKEKRPVLRVDFEQRAQVTCQNPKMTIDFEQRAQVTCQNPKMTIAPPIPWSTLF
jgi:hypothetical protein